MIYNQQNVTAVSGMFNNDKQEVFFHIILQNARPTVVGYVTYTPKMLFSSEKLNGYLSNEPKRMSDDH